MKYMIASDIHGSVYYCKEMVKRFEEEKADRLVLLGDILYHGPRNDLPKDYLPKEVAALLNTVKDKILCVKGNCDSEVDQMVLEFPVMAEYAILEEKDRLVFITHGHEYNLQNPPLIQQTDILLHGHTHVPVCQEESSCIYMNPGSVSIPKEESHHSYMTVENGLFLWKKLENGDIYKEYQI